MPKRAVVSLACLAVAAAIAWWWSGSSPAPTDLDLTTSERAPMNEGVLSGRQPNLAVHVRPALPTAKGPDLAIQVVSATGRPVPQADVQLTWYDQAPRGEQRPHRRGPWFYEHRVRTDDSGRATCSCVSRSATDLALWVSTPRWISRIQRLPPDEARERGVRIEATRSCTVRGLARYEDGSPAVAHAVLARLTDDNWPLPDQRFPSRFFVPDMKFGHDGI
ncbi:MAG: hypothetical protein R3F05_00360 [Planctomycetota bacterium]